MPAPLDTMQSNTSQRTRPSAAPGRAARCTEAIRDIAEDITVLAERLMDDAYGAAAPNTELLQRVVELETLIKEATGVLVVRQRAQGRPLSDLAPIIGRTEDLLPVAASPP